MVSIAYNNKLRFAFWLQSWPLIAQRVHDILNDYPRLRLTHGRKVNLIPPYVSLSLVNVVKYYLTSLFLTSVKVLEVRPVIDWDKGKALEFLLESLG